MTDQTQYTGWKCWEPSDSELVDLYAEGKCPLELKENEYLIVNDIKDGSNLAIYKKKNEKLIQINRAAIKINSPKDGRSHIVYNPKNIEQKCAFDLLHDDSITVKLLMGRFGSGKTFMLVVAALEALKEKKFEKIVWIRNNVDVKHTKDLGALKGDANEKMWPYLGPFIDHVGNKARVQKMLDDGLLEIEPLQFLRGRDIKNAIIMCSEAEQLTKEHLQLIISRASEGTSIWLDGDIKQRDKEVFEKSEGLEKMVEKLSGDPLFGFVKLTKAERSETAALADKLD